MFQSLFLLDGRFDAIPREAFDYNHLVSILVFIGWAF